MIDLRYNKGFLWHSHAGCHVKGFVLSPDSRYLDGKELAVYFSDSRDDKELESKLKAARGLFSLIWERKDKTILATDRTRTFPVFYRIHQDRIRISDSADSLNDPGDWSLDPDAMSEFRASGFVSGRQTLSDQVFQVQAGEILEFKEGNASGKFYFTYQVAPFPERSFDEYKDELERVSENTFEGLIRSLKGKTAVISLSGGYDSRYIAAMLKKKNYKKIICFSYGRRNNPDMVIAGKVAESLGVKFIPVVYDNELIRDFENDKKFAEYVDFSSNLTSMFFLQDYFAVKYLKNNNLIPLDSVFLPGHSADYIAGSMLIKHGLHDRNEPSGKTAARLFRIKYPYWPTPPAMLDRVEQTVREKMMVEDAMSYSVHEDWDLKEKFSKFIVNSCSVFSWFGYEYRLPFFDSCFIDFFQYVPYRYKKNKMLYDAFLQEGLFNDFDLNFEQEIQPGIRVQRMASVKQKIKNILPAGIYRGRPSRSDPIFYYEITKRLREDLAGRGLYIKIRGSSYNSLIIQWYTEYLRAKYPRNI